jgi:hypothetical protein
MYAFGIVAWEVMARQKPFAEYKSEIMFSAKIHQGSRPSLDDVPSDCPRPLLKMIENCWSSDRPLRKSAVECYSYLHHFNSFQQREFDVFLCFEATHSYIASAIFHELSRVGLKVYFELNDEKGSFNPSEIKARIQSSLVVVACMSKSFQENVSCMLELKEARTVSPAKQIITLALEENFMEWVSQDVIYLSQLLSYQNLTCDLNEIASHESWESESGPDEIVSRDLKNKLDIVKNYVENLKSESLLGSS